VTRIYEALKELALIALAYYVFWRYVRFTEIQAAILAVITGTLIFLVAAARKAPTPFEPFYIRIAPDWYRILRDQGLADDERLKSLNSTGNDNTKHAYSVLRDGITVTVLGPELYYSHNHMSFFSKLDLSEPIPELQTAEERQGGLSFAPRLYVKLILEKRPKNSLIRCIQIGLVTAESLKKSFHIGDDRANIPLATLPHAIFNGYNNGCFALDGKLKEAEIERLLKEYGWEHGRRDDDDDALNWPYEINHKYVRVSYYGV